MTKPGHPSACLFVAIAACVLAFAAPAHAAGGELVLVPDIPTLIALVVFFVLLVVANRRAAAMRDEREAAEAEGADEA